MQPKLKKTCSAKTAKEIINLITPDLLNPIIEKTNVNFHTRKLSAEIFLKLLILGQLLSSKGSQRKMSAVYSSELFRHIMPDLTTSVSHTAISKRLEQCSADFFEQTYFNLLDFAAPMLHSDKSFGFMIDAVDSTLVRATSRFMAGHRVMTCGPKGSAGASRPQIKYTMIFDNLSAVYSKLHTLPKYLSEENSLSEAIMEYTVGMPGCNLHKMTSVKTIFAFDRGLSSPASLVAIADENEAFVCRVSRARKFQKIEGHTFSPGTLPEGTTIIEDAVVRLPGSKKSGTAQAYFDTPFRLLKADLGKNIGFRSGTACKTETEIWLLTDILDAKLTSAEILAIYKERWKIEVFFRFLKQNLGLSHMMSLSENGLTIMMYVSLITTLLLAVYCSINGYRGDNGKFRLQLELIDDIITESEQLAKELRVKERPSKKRPHQKDTKISCQ